MTDGVTRAREHQFDGLVGPTHNYAGLSAGNLASMRHRGEVSNPRRAALEGLAKMRRVQALGVPQGVLPPHDRPSVGTLRRLGFTGSDEDVVLKAARDAPALLRLVSSAAPMWTANAATVAPSSDTADGRLHITPANLHALFHRAMEAPVTERVLRAVFADPASFVVHPPLPGGGQFADEGAANHARFVGEDGRGAHLFAWGRASFATAAHPEKYTARQTREASEAIARLHQLDPTRVCLAQQHPAGIDAGAFHTDVLAVGAGAFLMMHELAFANVTDVEGWLRAMTGSSARTVVAAEADLPVEDAVRSYVFNSQILTTAGGMVVLAPHESRENPPAHAFLQRVVEGDNPVCAVEYFDLRQSMHNGGGPACLRLRIPLTNGEVEALGGKLIFTSELDTALISWIERHYRDRLTAEDLRGPQLMRESFTALDELTTLLRLGSVYDFQLV